MWAKSVLRNVLKTGLALANTHRSKRTDCEGPDMEGDDWRETPSEPLAGHRTHCRTSYKKAAIHTIRQRAEGSLQMLISMDDDADALRMDI